MDEKQKELLHQVVETAVRTEEAVRGMEREMSLVRKNLHEYKINQGDKIEELESRVTRNEQLSARNAAILKFGMAILSALLTGAYAKILGILPF
jgi:hypothetical protein